MPEPAEIDPADIILPSGEEGRQRVTVVAPRRKRLRGDQPFPFHRVHSVLEAFGASQQAQVIAHDIPGGPLTRRHREACWGADPAVFGAADLREDDLLTRVGGRCRDARVFRRLWPELSFFYRGPYVSIDEGRARNSPWAGGAAVTAGDATTLRIMTPGHNLDANFVLWAMVLRLPGVQDGSVPVFYDAEPPAELIARLALALPQWCEGMEFIQFGARLLHIHKLLLLCTKVVGVKVASHIASKPNGKADAAVPSPFFEKETDKWCMPKHCIWVPRLQDG
eukprot:gene1849-4449_t